MPVCGLIKKLFTSYSHEKVTLFNAILSFQLPLTKKGRFSLNSQKKVCYIFHGLGTPAGKIDMSVKWTKGLGNPKKGQRTMFS